MKYIDVDTISNVHLYFFSCFSSCVLNITEKVLLWK
uniref:Uncharacterized protein n=1 Tax=Arundo donax TaxID=35708 RepID=A0A0A8ZZY7_ARUDO